MKLAEAKTLADVQAATETAALLAASVKAITVLVCPREGCNRYVRVFAGNLASTATDELAGHIWSEHGSAFDIKSDSHADPR